MRASCSPDPRRPPGRTGFTLTELLVATSILVILSLVLFGIAEQVTRVWNRGESLNQHRARARAALELMGREMRQALVPIDSSDTQGLQFAVNPAAIGSGPPSSVFWQAAVARDKSSGDLAEVGYFIRWADDGHADLCRLYIPSGNASFFVFSRPSAWITSALLDQAAPADAAHNFQGLFLENVVGLWVTAFAANGTAYAGGYDSRTHGNALPASVVISLVFLDATAAGRMKGNGALASMVRTATNHSADATDCLSLLSQPTSVAISQGASAMSFRVAFFNRQ